MPKEDDMADYPGFYTFNSKQSDDYNVVSKAFSRPKQITVSKLSQPLEKGERGGVVTNLEVFERVDSNGVKSGDTPVDKTILRTALLFVDKIDVPRNPLIHLMFVGRSIEGLKNLGLADCTMFKPKLPIGYDDIAACPWDAYTELNKREPGKWSIWQSPEYPIIPKDQLTPDLAFQLELFDSFVCPGPNVPFDDVLIFKDSHKDELTALRHWIEEAVIKLSNEGDPRAVALEFERLDLARNEYLKKSRQSNVTTVLQKMTVEMDWATSIRDAFIGVAGGGLPLGVNGFTLSELATAAGTGVLAGISLRSAAGLKKADPSPFRYIVQTEKTFG